MTATTQAHHEAHLGASNKNAGHGAGAQRGALGRASEVKDGARPYL